MPRQSGDGQYQAKSPKNISVRGPCLWRSSRWPGHVCWCHGHCAGPRACRAQPRAVLLVDTASGAQNCPHTAHRALCHQHGAGEEPSPAFSVPWGLAGRCCGHQGPRSTRGLFQVPHVRWPCAGDTASHPASSRINVGTARSSPPRPVVSSRCRLFVGYLEHLAAANELLIQFSR